MLNLKNNKDSALKVNKGVEQPPSINKEAIDRFKNTKHELLKITDYYDGILSGNRTILSQAITLVESSLEEHSKIAQKLIKKCLPHSGNSVRIGITGVPGVGKSTFIEALGKLLTASGRKLAVLAIDPSSERTKGSILGDKTRMELLANDKNAFIRPSPAAGSLGGVARKTRESIILAEAAGYDTIFIETVGVGQSETAVYSMVDFFLLLMLPGAGDELQGIKRGIMEMSDAIFINKADGENMLKAKLAKANYQNALHLFPPTESGWIPIAELCSAYTNFGINEAWKIISDYIQFTKENKYFYKKRQQQEKYRMFESINESLKAMFYKDKEIQKQLKQIEKDLDENKISSYDAANVLLEYYMKAKA
ncbi:MAG: methylmalonyl Co-A mutase-associated GTPase MeaB [Saprospiraceae bacterium]|nr:methylmalonyl Co-A mutase-associated GTPase MeaB [Saprospiraceae bacterium]